MDNSTIPTSMMENPMITVAQIKARISSICETIISNEVFFCELDSVAGDADLGTSLANGFRQIKAKLHELDDSSLFAFLHECSLIISEYCGGASGPLWGAAFRSAAKQVKAKQQLDLSDLVSMFEAAVSAIQRRGKAKLGDKTLLDALIPAVQALSESKNRGASINEAFALAAKQARAGAESTKSMVASRGRASYLGERSLNHPDAGAMVVSILFSSS